MWKIGKSELKKAGWKHGRKLRTLWNETQNVDVRVEFSERSRKLVGKVREQMTRSRIFTLFPRIFSDFLANIVGIASFQPLSTKIQMFSCELGHSSVGSDSGPPRKDAKIFKLPSFKDSFPKGLSVQTPIIIVDSACYFANVYCWVDFTHVFFIKYS